MTSTANVRDSFADLERHRLRLEETIGQLRNDLQHWQRWEAEYEGIKEEIQALSSDSSEDDILQAGMAFEGELVNEKEIRELIEYGRDRSSTVQQVCDSISGKIEDVHRTVEGIQKTLDNTELKLASVTVVSHPEERNEEGLPITEILEELDEDGNVISGTTSRPVDTAPLMLAALKKVGIKEQDILDGSPSQNIKTGSVDPTTSHQNAKKEKSVSFVEEINSDRATKYEGPRFQKSYKDDSVRLQNLNDLVKGSFSSNDRVLELDEYDNAVDAIGPPPSLQESAEDAALRRQMLRYNMDEMNHIVAELDLEEVGSDEEEDDELELGSLSSGSEIEEEEDDYGMATKSQISARYRRDMLELEKILNIRIMENVGQAADGSPTHGPKSPTSPRKDGHVRFSDHLDIAPTLYRTHSVTSTTGETLAPSSVNTDEQSSGQTAPTMTEVVVERKASSSASESTGATAPTKESRCKKSRAVIPADPEQSPAQKDRDILSDVVEHAPSSTSSAKSAPLAPDDYNPEQHAQEIREEYHKQRNRFLASHSSGDAHVPRSSVENAAAAADNENDNDNEEITEIIEGPSSAAPPKRVSHFKASRQRNHYDT